VKIPCKKPVIRPSRGRDRFVSDCAHHQSFQEVSRLAEAKSGRRLHHGLQFCSFFELQDCCFRKLNIATKLVGIEDRFDVLEAMTRKGRDLRHGRLRES
jgi:hypothetical protein